MTKRKLISKEQLMERIKNKSESDQKLALAHWQRLKIHEDFMEKPIEVRANIKFPDFTCPHCCKNEKISSRKVMISGGLFGGSLTDVFLCQGCDKEFTKNEYREAIMVNDMATRNYIVRQESKEFQSDCCNAETKVEIRGLDSYLVCKSCDYLCEPNKLQ